MSLTQWYRKQERNRVLREPWTRRRKAIRMPRGDYLAFGARLTARRGVDLPQARLTPGMVEYVRRNPMGRPRWQLAALCRVHPRTLDKVAMYETWAHIKG